MSDDSEIDWHRERAVKNRALIDELEASNPAGNEVFPETKAEIDRLKAQIEQSELIVAADEKRRNNPSEEQGSVGCNRICPTARFDCPARVRRGPAGASWQSRGFVGRQSGQCGESQTRRAAWFAHCDRGPRRRLADLDGKVF
jgi:hypothetical protein